MTTSEQSKAEEVVLYTTDWCLQSVLVENFLKQHNIAIVKIDIDGDSDARQKLIELNGGYASVPTVILPDGSMLTEPSLLELENRLNLAESPSLRDRIRKVFGGAGRRPGE